MDYFNAISEAASTSAAYGDQLIGFNNGLIIVALLFIIYWALIRDKRKRKKQEFPKFCQDCMFLARFRSGFCRKICRFHPLHKNSVSKSFYQKKAS